MKWALSNEVRPVASSSLPLRRVAVIGLGNALEFYDFLVFSYFSIQIGHAFFPSPNSLLLTLATFGAGFVTRPLGGWVLGRYGDRVGRKPAMLWSFGLMGASIVGLALTPSYAAIGIAAPVLLVLLRLVQGFAVGGEVGPSTAFLLESAPVERRGIYVGLLCSTVYLAVVVAGIAGFTLSTWLSPLALDRYGWRIAFLLGAAIVPLGWRLRRELPERRAEPEEGAEPRGAAPVGRRVVIAGVMIVAATTVTSYAMGYMATYMQDTLHLSAPLAFGEALLEGVVVMTATLAAGALSDRVGRRPLMLGALGMLLVLAVPGYWLIIAMRSALAVYTVCAVFNALYGVFWSVAAVAIVESLPASRRSGTYGLLYSATVAVFGGLTQFAMQWLIGATGSPLAPAWYLSATLLLGAVGMRLLPESAPQAARRGAAAGAVPAS